MLVFIFQLPSYAQQKTYERTFPQSKAQIEKSLGELQSILAGRLPVLEGFAVAGGHPLDRYRRGYYQSTVQVSAIVSGSLVRVKSTVTAWYADTASASGYQALPSNGRLETDLLDQLAEVLAKDSPTIGSSSPQLAKQVHSDSSIDTKHSADIKLPTAATTAPTAPVPQLPASGGTFPATVQQGLAAQEEAAQSAPKPSNDTETASLHTEAANLGEILKNQAHPTNLVAVKKSGTPVVATASLNAKSLFLASAHDEFEMLDFNQDWVHIRISGLSRGWIWRNSVEMPDGIRDTTAKSELPPAAGLFHSIREETSLFPGDWPPLRGKNVRIISIQKDAESTQDSGSEMKLGFAKSTLEKGYAALAQNSLGLAGIVLIFDSADGGMIAAPLPLLEQWKKGELSDASFWRRCFFDPPETFASTSSSASQ
jgi:hypothetical protein